jgi:hypothetical protein
LRMYVGSWTSTRDIPFSTGSFSLRLLIINCSTLHLVRIARVVFNSAPRGRLNQHITSTGSILHCDLGIIAIMTVMSFRISMGKQRQQHHLNKSAQITLIFEDHGVERQKLFTQRSLPRERSFCQRCQTCDTTNITNAFSLRIYN